MIKTYLIVFELIVDSDSREEAIEEARMLVNNPRFEPSFVQEES